jgi:hypothetical protein
MDTSFWTTLKAINKSVKFEGSKTLKKGFTSALLIEDRWLNLCNFNAVAKSVENGIIHSIYYSNYDTRISNNSFKKWKKIQEPFFIQKRILSEQVIAYKKEHPELKFNFGYYHTLVYGSESDLITLLATIPDLQKNIQKVCIPSSDESEQLLRDGYILTKNEPKMPFRAKTKSGYIKRASLMKVIKQVENSPDRYLVSGWFEHKVKISFHDWQDSGPDTQIWMGSSNIYFKNEHDIGLFAIIDSALTKKIEKVSIDPTQSEINKLNKIK